ncbi:MAG: hypothetical protein NTW16_01245 [Bacteroidetes bacterium]|nr:hypothetical protein [Bacteroidota bacterium]
MKKVCAFLCLFLYAGFNLFSQVSVNTDGNLADPSAMLDVKSTNKGLLPPRVALSSINTALPVTAPASGLLVYNTSVAGTPPNNVVAGYYSWNGTKWVAVAAPQGSSIGDMLYWNGTQWAGVPAGTNGQVLTFSNGLPVWGQPTPFCGIPLTINHVAGAVAPVSKTVTYGTVKNISGETSKCWITSNLGADHQATAVNDATEASAGWYWQFNRKQGYKNDGSTLTPAWTISSITEMSDWQATNDPCTIELGAEWRIPSNVEWYNVDNAGGWANVNGPWNSGLKLHPAGYLNYTTGLLFGRGASGFYWSNTQMTATDGYHLYFVSNLSHLTNFNKALGCTLRCLRNY